MGPRVRSSASLQAPGPFPAAVFLHVGLQARSADRMKRRTPAQPTNNRFLAAGYAIVEAAFRSRSDDPQTKEALFDCLAIIGQVKKMSEVEPKSVTVFGHSGGGSLALELAGDTELCAIVTGEPASILFTGMYNVETRRRDQRNKLMDNPKQYYTPDIQKVTREKIARIACPVPIVHGDQHPITPCSSTKRCQRPEKSLAEYRLLLLLP